MVNDALRSLRLARGWTQMEVAERVSDAVKAATGTVPAVDALMISRLERGSITWPGKNYREALRTVFDAPDTEALGLYPKRTRRDAQEVDASKPNTPTPPNNQNHHHLGEQLDPYGSRGGSIPSTGQPALRVQTPSRPFPVSPTSGYEADTIQLRVEVDDRIVIMGIDRRALLNAGFGSLLDAFALGRQLDSLPEIAAERALPERLAFASSAHVDEIVSHLNEQWHELVKTDNLLGPRHALLTVRNQISVLQALLRDARRPTRTKTVRLAAQYAESAAWLHEDSGDMTQARYWASQAMEWAYEAGDNTMMAWTVFRRSQQAAATHDAAQAIGLAGAARRDEERLPEPMRAAIRVQEAYGHALDGNELLSQQLLDEAHTWAARDTEGDARGGHGSYCTASYIEIHRAGCWLSLGQPQRAIALYEKAVPALPSVYQRDRATALGKMATAYAADGQPEQAATTARSVLPLARMTGSRRALDEIRGVGTAVSLYRQLPAVAEFLDDLAQDAA